ncbi:MAG TPA: alpha/beta hydrolase, partial [Actinomycetota bacterium]|nr:alpha/beta hydrolase [Actinomycetota bacterium]
MQNPETRYAKSGDVNIAHQVVGDGPIDIVLVDQWFSHVEAMWDVPPLARLVERLARFARVLLFDKRG